MMTSTGIDYHKNYSVLVTTDAQGKVLRRGRVEHKAQWSGPARREGLERYFKELDCPTQVVFESTWNWGWLHDVLEKVPRVERMVMAHPYKTRIIAEAQIKTDGLDAKVLAHLLRANLIAPAHMAEPETRQLKALLRQRGFWVKQRTQVRNRIHQLLDRQWDLERPQCADLFGKKGLGWLESLSIEGTDGLLLRQDLQLHAQLERSVRELEKDLQGRLADSEDLKLLQSIPGLGRITAAMVLSEIDGIERFASSDKLCAYAGLVPSTRSSGGRTYHGRMLKERNAWLQWALIEAAWVAVGCSSYFGGFYHQHKARGKKPNTAIAITAHRMAQIVWRVLKQRRPFTEHKPEPPSPAAPVKD